MRQSARVLKTRWDEAAIFRRPERGPLAQAIADQLRRRIVTGDLAVGRRLPSITRLSELYGVSRPTICSALHILAALGYVRISHGVGTFVRRPGAQITGLNHGWMHATPMELALIRATLDRQLAVAVATRIAVAPTERMPRTLGDLNLATMERRWSGHGWAEDFLRADFAYHQVIARSVRGAEVTAQLYGFLAERLLPHLVPDADLQYGDANLGELHDSLTSAILDGNPLRTGRIAGEIARREAAPLLEHVR